MRVPKSMDANVEAVENQPLMIRKAVDYLEQRAAKQQPFFLYFPMCPPHRPIVPEANLSPQWEP